MKTKKQRVVLTIAAILLVMAVSVGGTIAYLVDGTGEVENIFNPTRVTSSVVESFDGTTKKDVQIKNTGNTDAFIRVALVFTWKDADGNTLPYAVEAGDYTISLNLGTDAQQWTEDDGYYYFNSKVAANGGLTANLINSCTQAKTYSDGRKLCVEVIGSAIQAKGTTANGTKAVVDAWGVDPTTLQ